METQVFVTTRSITMDFGSFCQILPNDIRLIINEFSEMNSCSLVFSTITFLKTLDEVHSVTYRNGLIKIVFKRSVERLGISLGCSI
jgi:hypothetical protein